MPLPELVAIKCPLCEALWDRREAENDRAIHEVKCRCKRLIQYVVNPDGSVRILACQS